MNIMRTVYSVGIAVSCAIVFPVVLYLACCIVFGESYFYPQPAIDTHFAPDFTEAKFDRIMVGMDSAQVTSILGQPLGTQEVQPCNLSCCRNNSVKPTAIWYYSGDGKCEWFDFAWLSRDVWFDKAGKVNYRFRSIRHD